MAENSKSNKTSSSNGDKKMETAQETNPELQQPTIKDLKDWKHLQGIMRHIGNVQAGSELLAERLFDLGESNTARLLVQRTLGHDASKLTGIEWEHLRVGQETTDEFKAALRQHQITNDHHPEYWEGIRYMPRICIAEMACDLYARSVEFGTDLRAYIRDVFMIKHDFTYNTKVYKDLKFFVDMILDEPFIDISQSQRKKDI